jgi:hypothetical protein
MRLSTFLAIVSLFSASTLPAASSKADAEIDALLKRLRTSGCTFQRNGSWYEAPKAADHLQDKRAYFAKKGKLATAEDFIRLAATESSLSGKAYQVKCPDQAQQPSAHWLRAELGKLRQTKP